MPARLATLGLKSIPAAMLVLLAACGSESAPPPAPLAPTTVALTLTATADANPTPSGAGAPIALRVYQLTTAANFTEATFLPLYHDDATLLKSDLVQREDFLLAPGQTKTETINPAGNVRAIGIFAAYRDFGRANWRAVADIPANKTTNITVSAGATGVTLKAETVSPPPPKTGS